MRSMAVGILVGIVVASLAAPSAQLKPVPSPAPGVTNIAGEVAVTNRPIVLARQDGTWNVTCATAPPSAAPLLSPGQRVTLTFVNGASDNVKVTTVRPDGWITVGPRLINLATVVSID